MTKLGYFHSYFFSLQNHTHTGLYDWAGFFRLFCRLQKSVTNRECSSTISLYSIWPLPVAIGNTPGIAFQFLSYFLISQHCCRLSVLSLTEYAQSSTTCTTTVWLWRRRGGRTFLISHRYYNYTEVRKEAGFRLHSKPPVNYIDIQKSGPWPLWCHPLVCGVPDLTMFG